MTIKETAAFLHEQDSFVILTHKNPDGDTVGSAVALCLALRSLGKKAHVLENPGFTERFQPFLNGLVTVKSSGCCIVSVDVADAALLPLNARVHIDRIALSIDHHGTHRSFAPRVLVDAHSAACGELVLEVIDVLGVSLNREIARALYLAIATDTGCFSHSNTTARTHLFAARLFEYVSDIADLNHKFCVEKTRKRASLEARLLCEAEFFFEDRCAVLTITRALMEELSLCEDDLDNIASVARAIQGVTLAIVVRELKDGGCKASLRSSPEVDSAEICAKFGGGGHKCASGCTIMATPEETKLRLISTIKESEVFPL